MHTPPTPSDVLCQSPIVRAFIEHNNDRLREASLKTIAPLESFQVTYPSDNSPARIEDTIRYGGYLRSLRWKVTRLTDDTLRIMLPSC